MRQFAAVNSAAYATYGMPPEVHPDLFDNPDAVLEDPPPTSCSPRTRARPVATALVYESDGAATVQWVGTRPGARGSGLGALVTVWVTNLAFRRGASSVSLQASPMGAPVYLEAGIQDGPSATSSTCACPHDQPEPPYRSAAGAGEAGLLVPPGTPPGRYSRRVPPMHSGSRSLLRTAPWTRAPTLAFREPAVALVIIGVAFVIGVVAASGPLFDASTGSAALALEMSQQCAPDLGPVAIGYGPLDRRRPDERHALGPLVPAPPDFGCTG